MKIDRIPLGAAILERAAAARPRPSPCKTPQNCRPQTTDDCPHVWRRIWDEGSTRVATCGGQVARSSGRRYFWAAVEDPDTAADLTSVLCIVGSVFAALSRYATVFWNQGLHQDASLSIDKEEHVADVFYYPLIVVMAGFVLLFITLVLLNTRSEIMMRRASAIMARGKI